jgi:hypothetical protein
MIDYFMIRKYGLAMVMIVLPLVLVLVLDCQGGAMYIPECKYRISSWDPTRVHPQHSHHISYVVRAVAVDDLLTR